MLVFLEKLWLSTASKLGLNPYAWRLVADMVTSRKREKKGIGCTPFVMVFNLRVCKKGAENSSLSHFPFRGKEAGKTTECYPSSGREWQF